MSAGTRRLLLLVLVLGLLGTSADLLLIGHYDDRWQIAPLATLLASALAVLWHAAAGSHRSARALQAAMFALLAAAAAGLFLHHRGAREFALETDPSLAGARLFWKVVRAKAPPALAPASLVPLGLIGLAFATTKEDR